MARDYFPACTGGGLEERMVFTPYLHLTSYVGQSSKSWCSDVTPFNPDSLSLWDWWVLEPVWLWWHGPSLLWNTIQYVIGEGIFSPRASSVLSALVHGVVCGGWQIYHTIILIFINTITCRSTSLKTTSHFTYFTFIRLSSGLRERFVLAEEP